MVVTLFGIFTLVRLLHSEKAEPQILTTPSDMVMPVRPWQPLKAYCPILVTLLGIVILVRLRQSEKAFCPILVTVSGMVM